MISVWKCCHHVLDDRTAANQRMLQCHDDALPILKWSSDEWISNLHECGCQACFFLIFVIVNARNLMHTTQANTHIHKRSHMWIHTEHLVSLTCEQWAGTSQSLATMSGNQTSSCVSLPTGTAVCLAFCLTGQSHAHTFVHKQTWGKGRKET